MGPTDRMAPDQDGKWREVIELRKGQSEPFYEHLALKALGIDTLKQTTKG